MRLLDSLALVSSSVVAAKGRCLALVMGVLIPVALISGVSTSIDRNEFNRLVESLDGVWPDIAVGVTSSGPGSVLDRVVECGQGFENLSIVGSAMTVAEVVIYGRIVKAGALTGGRGGGGDLTTIRLIGLPGRLIAGDAGFLGIHNYRSLAKGHCLIERNVARELDLVSGERITVSRRMEGDREMSDGVKLVVEGVVDLDDGLGGRFRDSFPSGGYQAVTIVVDLDTLPQVLEILETGIQRYEPQRPWGAPSPGLRVLISLDRDQLYQYSSTVAVKDTVIDLENTISESFNQVKVENHALQAVRDVESDSHNLRGQFVALSLPLLGLSIYIGLVIGENNISMRMGEISLLRVRGLRPRGVLKLLLVEVVILGVIASLAGVAAGSITSYIFSPIIAAGTHGPETGYLGSRWINTPSLETIAIAVSVGMALAVIPTLSWSRKADSIEPHTKQKSIQERDQDMAGRWRLIPGEKMDIFMVVLGLSSIASTIIARSTAGSVPGVWGMITTTVLPILWSIQPAVPFLLILGTTRLLVRWDASIKAMTNVMSPLSGRLSHLAPKIQESLKTQNWRSCLVIALCIGFTGLVTVSTSTMATYRKSVAPLITGGDIKITDLYSHELPAVSTYLKDQNAEISVTQRVVSFFSEGELYVINPTTYPVDARINPQLREQISKNLKNLQETNKGALTSTINGRPRGDEVTRRYYIHGLANYTTLTSAGSFKALPGLGQCWLGTRTPSTVLSNNTYQQLRKEIPELRTHGNTRYVIIANLPPENDLSRVKQQITDLLPGHNWKESDITTITDASTTPARKEMSKFVKTEIYYLLLIAGLGVAVIITTLTTRTAATSWVLSARGLRTSKIALLLSNITLPTVILGLVTGILTGTLTGYLWTIQSIDPKIPVTPTPTLDTTYYTTMSISCIVFIGLTLFISHWQAKRTRKPGPYHQDPWIGDQP